MKDEVGIQAIAHKYGNAEMSQKSILVVCTGNRCRSQMAQGWLKHFGGDGVEVASAGTQPKGVHPRSIEVMADAGVDISSHTSDHIDQYSDRRFDVVVTVCDSANEACPVFTNADRRVHHSFTDPDADLPPAEQQALFCRVRDEIRDWAKAFVETL